jgi:hypothetical protein
MYLKYFEHVAKRGFFRPIATVTFPQAVAMCAEAMRHARSLDLTELLVNTNGLTDSLRPTCLRATNGGPVGAERRRDVEGGDGLSPRNHGPQKIGVVMAQNRGVAAEVFTSESAAIAWLDALPGASRAERRSLRRPRGKREHATMKVNHLHLMVPDVPAASAFFEKYFELRKANGNAGSPCCSTTAASCSP